MKLILIKVIFLAISISLVKSDCYFQNFTNNYQPLFFQKIHSEAFFVPANNNTISIPDGGSVLAYCSEGFRSFKIGGSYSEKTVGDKDKEITIECRKSIIYLNIDGETYSQGVNLQCKKPTISLHSVRTYMCGHETQAFIMDMEYNSQKIAFAEICYDFTTMQLKYIYHKAASRSPILSQEKKNSVVTEAYHNPVEQISNSLSISEEEIKSQTKLLFGSFSGAVEYVYDHLVPLDSFDPFDTDSMDTTSYLTKILWWKPLKDGNWRLFLDLLKKQSLLNEYNVITGVSGTATYFQPDCKEYKDLNFEVNGLKKKAPKIIWSYLTLNRQPYRNSQHDRQARDIIDPRYQNINHSRHPQQNRNFVDQRLYSQHQQTRDVLSFVVIGHNTPFYDRIILPEMDICNCNKIPWLKDLWRTQTMFTLGHITCCPYEVAKRYIPELPELPIEYFGQLIKNPDPASDDNKDVQSNEDNPF